MIDHLKLRWGDQETYYNESGCELEYLTNIKHINVFVGENNSGKSRFIRSLINKDAYILSEKNRVSRFSGERIVSYRYIKDMHRTFPDFKMLPYEDISIFEQLVFYRNQLKLIEKKYGTDALENPIYINFKEQLDNKASSFEEKDASGNPILLSSLSRAYIPVLRGIECFNLYFNDDNEELDSISMNKGQREAWNAFKQSSSSIYKTKISKVYDINSKYIFTGENLYDEIRDKLLGSEKDRNFIRAFERFISDNFYDGKGFAIIPLIKEGFLNVKIGDSEERHLHDLGDGIKQIICILYKAFEFRNKEAVICIEEPEINLHPGFQRKLMKILSSRVFSKIYFFITTHSNHIVDSGFDTKDMSIFTFVNVGKSNNKFQIYNSSPKDINILNQLGVNNSSVFMANCTIWVEGISDKIYLNKYLSTYVESEGRPSLREGIDYTFVEYGGNNITHWSFYDADDETLLDASGITNRMFLIADNDNDTKMERKAKLKQVFKENFYVLPVREIENTIEISVLKRVLFGDERVSYKPGMNLKSGNYANKTTYIWKYIDDHYCLEKNYWNEEKNQTTVNKHEFAQKICAEIKTVNDLSKSAIEITERLYRFISEISNSINC